MGSCQLWTSSRNDIIGYSSKLFIPCNNSYIGCDFSKRKNGSKSENRDIDYTFWCVLDKPIALDILWALDKCV